MYVQTSGTLYYMPQRANPRSMTELVEISKMVMLGEVNTLRQGIWPSYLINKEVN